MANNCYTVYKVEGDQIELTTLFNKMQELENAPKSLEPNEFGKNWLGNLVIAYGGDWQKIRCRGEFFEPKVEDGVLLFATESAWTAPDDTIKFLQSKFPSLEFYYAAEEPGCCYYVTNDAEGKHFPERFIVEQSSAETTYQVSEEELLKDISERIGKSPENLQQMYEMLEEWNDEYEENENEQIQVREIEIVE